MAFDFTGLVNQNEFYPDYYWHTRLPDKFKEFEKRVKTQDPRWGSGNNAPPHFLSRRDLSARYLTAQSELRRALSPNRPQIHRAWVSRLLEILGYAREYRQIDLDSSIRVPVLGTFKSFNQPYLWIIEGVDFHDTGSDLLSLPVSYEEGALSLRKVITKIFFGSSDHIEGPPRWILVAGLETWILVERDKWGDQRMLRFQWDELYRQLPSIDTWKILTMLLDQSSLCPEAATSFQEELQEQAKKHASGVSGSLKYALRESVELLGNEFVTSQRTKGYSWQDIYKRAEPLTLECLYYMYRLLFLFNVEARLELGYLPMDAVAYRNGYSLEKLRELEMISLDENGSSEGYFFHDSIMLLFELVYKGYDEEFSQQEILESGIQTFKISPLKCDLFDPEKTPLLNSVKIPNRTWQKIIQMMSLEHEEFVKKKRKKKGAGRGRISYRHLTVNHLGAVYEALLSYHGFIAQEELYEVKVAKKSPDILDPAYFVNEQALNEHYGMNERVINKDGTLRKYPKGTFIYRLTGRAREESASYYTPESLTQLITEFTLKEVLEGKSADEILELTVCEPAMGSAAFLNEAITQLAEAYMRRKTEERGDDLDPDKYKREFQRVKMYLADNNVYGVDLNPTAVKLGEISIWLNTLVPGGFVPWFGNQLKCGNSLVGAWRRVYTKQQVTSKKWWETAPSDILLSEDRPEGMIYHFLLGDAGMAQYKDKEIKSLVGDQIAQINEWRKLFTQAHSDGEVAQLLRLSSMIDSLWGEHVEDLLRLDEITTDAFAIYPNYDDQKGNLSSGTPTRIKEDWYEKILNPKDENTSAYQRLKLVMDYWCALWYWPIDKADLLPHRTEYFSDLSAILSGKADTMDHDMFTDHLERDTLGYIDMKSLIQSRERLQVVRKLGEKYHFHHWQLEYADIFKARGGFDIVLGNPPWLKPTFVEKNIIGETDPQCIIKKFSAQKVVEFRKTWLLKTGHTKHYTSSYSAAIGQLDFLNAIQNYPLLKGMQTNLYKPFICMSWAISAITTIINSSHMGTVGLLHPDSIYDDGKGQKLRRSLYPRLRWRLQFENVFKLFEEVAAVLKFSVNVYGEFKEEIMFNSMVNLYSPVTAKKSIDHDGFGPVPGIKTYDDQWNLKGHKHRVIPTTVADLRIYSDLYDEPETPPNEACLPCVHSRQLVNILKKLSQTSMRMRDLEYKINGMWHESDAQKDGTIRRDTQFIENPQDWILSGPHIFVGNPFFQTPNDGCKTKNAFSRLDLTTLPDDYLPRSNYIPACSKDEYIRRTPKTPWGTLITDEFRVVMRSMIGSGNERTLIPAFLPPSAGHVDGLLTVGGRTSINLLQILINTLSIVTDMILKISGKGHINVYNFAAFPFVKTPYVAILRALRLSCLTTHYSEIWEKHFLIPQSQKELDAIKWSKYDKRLEYESFEDLSSAWSWQVALRSDYERRQALLEIDVLHAQALGLTLDDLLILYRIQFPILQSYERDTWYDTKGRTVFSRKSGESPVPRTKSTKKTNFGIHTPNRSETNIPLGWNDIKDLKEGIVTYTFMDDTMPGGPRERTIEFHAPFDRCDREEDYRQAWAFFEEAKASGTLI